MHARDDELRIDLASQMQHPARSLVQVQNNIRGAVSILLERRYPPLVREGPRENAT